MPLGPAQLDLARRGESAAASPCRAPSTPPSPSTPPPSRPPCAPSPGPTRCSPHASTPGRGGIHAAPLAADTVCTVADGVPRSREREALAAAGQELRPSARRSLHAVLLRGRRRLVLLAHELVADQISLGILLADLRAALARPEEELGAEAVRYPEWAAALPAVATDPRECDHWREVAEGRAAAAAFRSRSPLPDTTPERHQGFVLGRAATARLTGPVARRFGLLPAQLLTGALGLALVRWRGTRVASFDVCTDGRQGTPALDRTVGPLAETEPVLLDGAPDEQATEFTERAARSLSAVGRAAFGACREHAADPALRLVLRELVPVLVRFTPDTAVRPVPRPARTAGPYAIEAGARVRGGRLHVGCDWLPAAHDGVTAESVDALLAEVRAVLDELADTPGEPSGQFPVAASPSSANCSPTPTRTPAPAARSNSSPGSGTGRWTPAASPPPGSPSSTGRPSSAPPSTTAATRPSPSTTGPCPRWCASPTPGPPGPRRSPPTSGGAWTRAPRGRCG
ncbi:condensation domain-containing protein [Actinomadura keratinilytica]